MSRRVVTWKCAGLSGPGISSIKLNTLFISQIMINRMTRYGKQLILLCFNFFQKIPSKYELKHKYLS